MNLVEATEKLAKAKGRSEHVMSIFLDIRGFSAFSKLNESPNIAIYVKKLFLKVLKEYFPEATYAKPTGDGLLIIYSYDEESLASVASKVVMGSLNCVEDFPSLCANEPMLNFSLPDKVGFGISRGLACCLFEGETIIDYSGHMLNLAARLNGVARPCGVVIDGSFLTSGLDGAVLEKFGKDLVYLKGVADEESVEILYQVGVVEVGDQYKKPLNKVKWIKEKIEFENKDFGDDVGIWQHNLQHGIDEEKGLRLTLITPSPTKSKPNRHNFIDLKKFSYRAEPTPCVELDMVEIKEIIFGQKLKKTAKVIVSIEMVRLT